MSIHYPKGSKKPEVLVSRGPEGEIIKDVQITETGDVPEEDTPRLIFPEAPTRDSFPDLSGKPVVPTEIERFYMEQSAQAYKEQQHQHHEDIPRDATETSSAEDANNVRQDDHHRKRKKKPLKGTKWKYKNLSPRRKARKRKIGSSQTYDMSGIREYERFVDRDSEKREQKKYKGTTEESFRYGKAHIFFFKDDSG